MAKPLCVLVRFMVLRHEDERAASLRTAGDQGDVYRAVSSWSAMEKVFVNSVKPIEAQNGSAQKAPSYAG